MREKFSIVKQLDIEKLSDRCRKFECINDYKPYIFANKETLDELSKPYTKWKPVSGEIYMFQNYRVFEDSKLDFGEIELR